MGESQREKTETGEKVQGRREKHGDVVRLPGGGSMTMREMDENGERVRREKNVRKKQQEKWRRGGERREEKKGEKERDWVGAR